MLRFLGVILVIVKIGSVENTVLLEKTTTDISHTINKVRGEVEEHWLWGDGDGDHIHLLYRDQHQLHHVTRPGKEMPSTVSNKLIQCGFVRVESGHLSSETMYIIMKHKYTQTHTTQYTVLHSTG